MTQGPYWDWLYKNGRPPPTPDWGPGAQQFYPPGQPQPLYLPNPLAGDPSGGMAWRNSLRVSPNPKMPWHYFQLPFQMQGGPTPYQSRPNFRNDYEPVDTTRAGSGYPLPTGVFDPGNPNKNPFWDWVYGRGADYPPGVTPPGWPTNPTPSMTPLSGGGGGKPMYSPARQSSGPPPPPWPAQQPAPSYGVGQTGVYNAPAVAAPAFSAPTLAPLGAPAAPTRLAPNPGTPPPGWDVPGEWGAAAPAAASSGGFQTPYGMDGGGAPGPGAVPWAWAQYDPKNPGAVPQDLWGDQAFLTYAQYVNDLAFANSGGGGGGGNTAWQNAFDQQQADARNAQWAQNFAQQGAQWDQKMAFEQADAARKADQWQKEMERNRAVDQWTQAFQQAQQDWSKIDAEAKNRLTDQGQNLAAFNRRFGPHVGYM